MTSARTLGPLAFATLLTTGAVARADIAPPSGVKYVGFEFVVKGAPSSGDLALVAFPCSSSNGVPVTEAARIKPDAPVTVGRRGGSCALHVVSTADYDAMIASLPSERRPRDEALRAFFEKKATRCEGRPSLSMTLPSSDPRDRVREELAVAELSATRCRIVAASVQPAPSAPPAPSTSVSPAPSASASPASSVAPPTVPTAGGPPPSRSGCSVAPAATSGGAGLVLAACLTMLVARLGARRRSTPAR